MYKNNIFNNKKLNFWFFSCLNMSDIFCYYEVSITFHFLSKLYWFVAYLMPNSVSKWIIDRELSYHCVRYTYTIQLSVSELHIQGSAIKEWVHSHSSSIDFLFLWLIYFSLFSTNAFLQLTSPALLKKIFSFIIVSDQN